MIKLIRANIQRMLMNRTLYIFIVVTMLMGIVGTFVSAGDIGLFNTGFTGDVSAEYMNNLLLANDYTYDIRGVGTLIVDCGLTLIIICSFYISIFAGRFFDDGAVRNMVMIGHKRSAVYLSALVLNMISSAILTLAMFVSVAAYIVIGGMRPIIWWPYVLIMIAVIYVLVIVVTSLVLAVVFVSHKTYIAVLSSIVLSVGLTMIAALPLTDAELMPYIVDEQIYFVEDREESLSDVVISFDDKDYRCIYIKDGSVLPAQISHDDLSGTARAKIAAAKCIPLSVMIEYSVFGMNPYTVVSSNAALRYVTSGLVWILISTGAGVLLFRKKDII